MMESLAGHTFAPLALAALWIASAAVIAYGIVTLTRIAYVKIVDRFADWFIKGMKR